MRPFPRINTAPLYKGVTLAALFMAACAGDGGLNQSGDPNNGGDPTGFGGDNNNNSPSNTAGNAGGNTNNNGGNTNTNKGGMTGTGGASATGGTAVPTPTTPGGYLKSGAWQGYAWAAVGGKGSVMPANFGMVRDFPLCASGTVDAGTSNTAMIGWNLNQASTTNPPVLTVNPAQKGIQVKVRNPGGSTLRLQLQGPKGATDATDRWCATIAGTGGFIPYDAFNTECWEGGKGTAYKGQPLAAAIVLVPGKESASTPFDFCIEQLGEGAGDASPPVGTGCALSGGPGEGTGSISGDEARLVTRGGRNYLVQNNVWNGNKQAQRLNFKGVSFEVSMQGNTQPTNGAPASYPSVFIGRNFGRMTSGSNLPRRVGDLAKVPTAWRWKAGANGQWNVSYDVWFSNNAGGDANSPTGGYLMVWLHKPNNAQPLGGVSGTETIAGKSWQVWTCPGACQNGVPVISYVPAGGQSILEMQFDLNDFIKNAKTKFPNQMKDSWYLTNVFAGFEIWNGGQGLTTEDFCAIVE